MPVEIDPGFVRAFADQTLVMHLGRDIDLAFLAVGPKLDRVQKGKDDEPDRMRLRSQLNEVARIRIAPPGAAAMAMDILSGLITAGVVDKTGLIVSIEAIEEPQPEESDDDAATNNANEDQKGTVQ